eukprot:353618-Chlamydomonas_euryale.AAC.6
MGSTLRPRAHAPTHARCNDATSAPSMLLEPGTKHRPDIHSAVAFPPPQLCTVQTGPALASPNHPHPRQDSICRAQHAAGGGTPRRRRCWSLRRQQQRD